MHRAAVWQHSSNSNIKIVHNSIEHFLWNSSDFFSDYVLSFLSMDCFHKLCLSGTPSENRQVGWDLGNRMVRSYWFDAKRVCPMGCYAWGIQVFCSRNEATSHILNRTLDYLRHNFQWDRLISHQIDNSWPSYSQDLNLPIFWGGTWKIEFVKTIHRQERTSSEEKSEGFHKKCSIELRKILMFELLLCCLTAAWCMVLITEKV